MRYFHEGSYYCFRLAPNSKPLIHGLKMCESCSHRVTSEDLKTLEKEKKVKTDYFCTLGVKHAKKDPSLFVCTDDKCFYRNQWIHVANCQTLEGTTKQPKPCRFLRRVIVEETGSPRNRTPS